MGLVTWIVVGLVLGWLASLVMKGHGARLQSDLILGVGGALLGGILSTLLFALPNGVTQINEASIGWSLVISILFLVILQLAARRNRVR